MVFLGDLVDRGPDSFGVVERVMQLCVEGRAVCLRGNHELMMVDALSASPSQQESLSFWLAVGGRQTLASYPHRVGPHGEEGPEVSKEHLDFLRTGLLPYYEDEHHLYVHATCDPSLPLEEQDDRTLMWLRFGDPAPHISGKTLVTGHTPQKEGAARDLGHALCIDTFCYGGGCLTAFETSPGTPGGGFFHADQSGNTWTSRREFVPA